MKLENVTAAVAACPPICVGAYPKVLIASDSTTAKYDGGPMQGWGAVIPKYLNLSVINLAKNGRSTRSFANDGYWKQLLDLTYAGDFVVIEFGHNDEGDPTSKNNTRAFRNTLPGTGDESVEVTVSVTASLPQARQGRTPLPPPGVLVANVTRKEVVHTYGWYLKQMIVDVRDKGGIPVLSSRTPSNDWSSNSTDATLRTTYPFRDYTQKVAQALKVDFVDHTYYSILGMAQLGQKESKKFFPLDSTHTSAKGATFMAETFVRAARCAGAKIAEYLNEDGLAVEGACL